MISNSQKNIQINQQNTMVKAAIYYLVCQVVVNGMVFIITPIFTRMMSKEDYGIVSNFLAWESMLFPLVTLNLRSTITRSKFVFSDTNDSFLTSILSVSSVVTIASYLLIELNVLNIREVFSLDIKYIRMLFLYILFKTAFEYQQIQFKNYYKYKLFVLYSFMTVFSSLFLSVILVQLMEDKLSGRIIGIVLPTIIINLFIYFDIWRRGRRVSLKHIKFAFFMAIPLLPSALSATLLGSSDRVIITKFCSSEETALYGTAYTVYSIASIVWTALQQAWEPWLNDNLASKNYENIKDNSKIFVKIYAGLIIGIMLVAPEIILIMGGKSYYEAVWVMPPIILSMVFQFLYTFYFNVEYHYGETYLISLGTFLAAVVNIGLNYIFVPQYGYIAAAYTTLMSYGVMLFYHFMIVKIKVKKDYVYDNRYFFMVLVGLFISQILIALLYNINLVRYCIILLYGLGFLIFMWKSKDKILSIVKK